MTLTALLEKLLQREAERALVLVPVRKDFTFHPDAGAAGEGAFCREWSNHGLPLMSCAAEAATWGSFAGPKSGKTHQSTVIERGARGLPCRSDLVDSVERGRPYVPGRSRGHFLHDDGARTTWQIHCERAPPWAVASPFLMAGQPDVKRFRQPPLQPGPKRDGSHRGAPSGSPREDGGAG